MTRAAAIGGPDDPRHGTLRGYQHLKCRCDRCREVWAAYCRKRRQRGTAPVHGTSGYLNYGCRCEVCVAAASVRNARAAASRRAQTVDYAVNARKEWTDAELRVAARSDLTCVQAALLLGRTAAAVEAQRHLTRTEDGP